MSSQSTFSGLLPTIFQYVIVLAVLICVTVLAALGTLSATVTAGLIGVVLGHGGAVLVGGAGK